MKRFLGKAALAACLLLGAHAPSFAQALRPYEWSEFYADVRGWTVESVIHEQGGFTGCRALKDGPAGPLIIGRLNGFWNIVVPTYQTGTFGGAILSVDKNDIDSQFGFFDGWASRELGNRTLDLIKSGRELGVEINGDAPRRWSLSGSTAALLKVQECLATGGVAPQQQARSAPRQPAPPPPPSQPQTVTANCDSIITGPYRCTVTRLPAEPGYREIYRVEGANDAPAYFIKIKSDDEADVWASFGGEPWRYVGIWGNTGPDCSEPKPNQSQEAWNNLGQDAWNICIR